MQEEWHPRPHQQCQQCLLLIPRATCEGAGLLNRLEIVDVDDRSGKVVDKVPWCMKEVSVCVNWLVVREASLFFIFFLHSP